ncbi:hypothetical protein LXA43DRAFT_1093299 [Ganoderma leucocontextum]|nr:hypothetical protein LXA43DRAFT_1093299 [Ganoderma leucocontextum]
MPSRSPSPTPFSEPPTNAPTNTAGKRPRSPSPENPRKRVPPTPAAESAPAQAERNTLPLPRRLATTNEMANPLVKYNPADFDGLPKARDENPHLQRTRKGPAPQAPKGEHLIFTNEELPHAHVPDWNFAANVVNDQLARLDPLKPRLLAVPGKNDKPKKFAHPWAYFLEVPVDNAQLREYLLWQEVFAVHPTLSFSIHPITEERPSWMVMVLTGADGAVVDSLAAKQAVLAEIKRKAWADVRYCTLAAELVASNWGVQDDVAARVKAATDAFDLVVARAEQHGTEKVVTAYILFAKPLSLVREEHEAVVRCLTVGPYWRGLYLLDVNRASVACKLCKDAAHCAADCLLPQTPGWQGPMVVDILSDADAGPVAAGGGPSVQQQIQSVWKDAPTRGKRGGQSKSRGGGAGRASSRGGNGGGRRR